MALSKILTEEDAVQNAILAAQPVLNYQNDAYENAEEAYYAQQSALALAAGKGKESEIAPFPARPEQPMPAPAPERQTISLGSIVAPEQQPVRTLSPCEMGLCGSYGGVNVGGTPVLAQNTDKGIVSMSGTQALGRNRLGQLLVAGRLASQGATVETLEKGNKAQELYNLEQMRRTPEWLERYEALLPHYNNDPRLAGAQADFVTGNAYGGEISSQVNRWLAPQTYDQLNKAEERNAVLAMANPEYANVLANRPVIEGGLNPMAQITGYQANGDGTNTFNVLMGGQELSSTQSADTTPLAANALFNPNYGISNLSTDLQGVQNLQLKRQQVENTAQNNANNYAIKQAQLQRQAQNDGIKQQIDLLRATGGLPSGSNKTGGETFGTIPKEFTSQGFTDYYKQINATNNAVDTLRYGAAAVGKANDPKAKSTSLSSKNQTTVPQRQAGFATNGRIADSIIDSVSKSSPVHGDMLRTYNTGFQVLQNQAIWQDPQAGAQAYMQIGQAIRDGEKFQQVWAQSSNAASKATAEEMSNNLNYMRLAHAKLGTYIDNNNKRQAVEQSLNSYKQNALSQLATQLQEADAGL